MSPTWGGYGNLYVPHVYEPNQSLTDLQRDESIRALGLWSLGAAQYPGSGQTPQAPEMKAALPLPTATVDTPWDYTTSTVPEAFNDVMMVNGTVYPYMEVQPKAYRFRILNACQ